MGGTPADRIVFDQRRERHKFRNPSTFLSFQLKILVTESKKPYDFYWNSTALVSKVLPWWCNSRPWGTVFLSLAVLPAVGRALDGFVIFAHRPSSRA